MHAAARQQGQRQVLPTCQASGGVASLLPIPDLCMRHFHGSGSCCNSNPHRNVQAARLCGASVDREKAYPGWQPAPESRVVQLTRKCLHSLIGHEPKVRLALLLVGHSCLRAVAACPASLTSRLNTVLLRTSYMPGHDQNMQARPVCPRTSLKR